MGCKDSNQTKKKKNSMHNIEANKQWIKQAKLSQVHEQFYGSNRSSTVNQQSIRWY